MFKFIPRFFHKILPGFVYIVCGVIFLVQAYSITYDYIWPATTNTVSYQEELQADDFPAQIRVCIRPGFDKDQVFKAGYEDPRYYFRGTSRFNSSIFGWTGHYGGKHKNFTAEGKTKHFLKFVCSLTKYKEKLKFRYFPFVSNF